MWYSIHLRRAGQYFATPYHLPNPETFDLVGYETVFAKSQFNVYYFNSLFVTLIALGLILFFGAMVAFALAEYPFPGNNLLRLFFLLGIIIPIRLGSVSLLRLIDSLNLIGSLWALIVVYVAGGLPLAVFILSQFMAQVPGELKDAARVDGASEYRVFWLILPIVPARHWYGSGDFYHPHVERSLFSSCPGTRGSNPNRDLGRAAVHGAILQRLERPAGSAVALVSSRIDHLLHLLKTTPAGIDRRGNQELKQGYKDTKDKTAEHCFVKRSKR